MPSHISQGVYGEYVRMSGSNYLQQLAFNILRKRKVPATEWLTYSLEFAPYWEQTREFIPSLYMYIIDSSCFCRCTSTCTSSQSIPFPPTISANDATKTSVARSHIQECTVVLTAVHGRVLSRRCNDIHNRRLRVVIRRCHAALPLWFRLAYSGLCLLVKSRVQTATNCQSHLAECS